MICVLFQNTTDMEVTLPPLQVPRVVQEDSIANVTPQACESETEDNGDLVYQLIEHFIIIISGYVSVYYVYNYIIMFSCVHQGDVDCKSGVTPTSCSVFGHSVRTNNDGATDSTLYYILFAFLESRQLLGM